MNKKTITSIGAGIAGIIILLLVLWFALSPGSPSVERTKESVKLVMKFRQGGATLRDTFIGWGSAFVINDNGCLVTNAHVAGVQDENGNFSRPGPADILYVVYEKQVRNRKIVVLQKAIVEHMDASRDMALLRVNPDRTSMKPLRLAESAQSGQAVMAMGFPAVYDIDNNAVDLAVTAIVDQYGFKERKWLDDRIELDWNSAWGDLLNVITESGFISGIRRGGGMHTSLGKDATARIIDHSAKVHAGMSGGPLVDNKGQVVGVTYGALTAKGSNAPLISSAVEVSEIRHFLMDVGLPTENPDWVTSRVRAYLNNAKPYEIALSVLGVVVAVGAVIALVFLIVGRNGHKHEDDYGYGPEEDEGPVMEETGVTVPLGADPEKPTIPFPKAGSGSGASNLSVVLTGKAPNGETLRFRFTERDLQTKASRSLLIGRGKNCDILLPYDSYISRQQARIMYEQDRDGNGLLYIKDENATNTTCINGEPIQGKCPLEPDDRITMGPITLLLTIEG